MSRLLGRSVEVLAGPEMTPVLGGMRPMVFAHAAKFIDDGGVSDEGARIARRQMTGPGGLLGFAEERPARVIVEVACVSSAYKGVKELCSVVTPQVLSSLESLQEVDVDAPPRDAVKLKFADFTACLQTAEFARREAGGVAYHAGRLVFHLNGFLHVRVTWRRPPRPPRDRDG